MKSKRSKACEFSADERKAICERDSYRCVICGSHQALTVAHLISRGRGGLGIRQNGALLCVRCHQIVDQGSNSEVRKAYQQFLRKYLETNYPEFTDDERMYKKWSLYKR